MHVMVAMFCWPVSCIWMIFISLELLVALAERVAARYRSAMISSRVILQDGPLRRMVGL